jgi:AbrB family looped-hinge helix DNA binding protein
MLEATVDKFGRVVIPKKVRDDLGLKPGSVLQIEETDQEVIMKPLHAEPKLIDKGGVLVFSGTATGDIAEAVRAHREKRLEKLSRK